MSVIAAHQKFEGGRGTNDARREARDVIVTEQTTTKTNAHATRILSEAGFFGRGRPRSIIMSGGLAPSEGCLDREWRVKEG